MSLLSTAQLTALRGVVTSRWPESSIEIRRNTPVSDGQGGQTDTWATAATVSGRLVRKTGKELAEGGRIASVGDWYALLPIGTDVRVSDRLRVDGAEYDVLATDAGQSERLVLRCEVRRVE